MFVRKVLTGCVFAILCGTPVFAQQYTGTLNVVTASSSLTMSGDLNSAPFTAQAAGSLTTSYSGTLGLNVDLTANTVQFTNLGTALANINGTWIPAVGGGTVGTPGSAQGNYGIVIAAFLLNGAFRNLSYTVTSGAPISMTGTGPYAFNVNGGTQSFTTATGTLDYNSGPFNIVGTTSVAGGLANNTNATAASLVDGGSGVFTVTFPVTLNFAGTTNIGTGSVPFNINFNGSITATGTLTPVAVPEPATVAMIGASIGLAGFVAYRQRKAKKKAMEASV